MKTDIKIKDKELKKRIDRFLEKLPHELSAGVADAFDLIGQISQAKYWISPGGEGLRTNPSKLTVRSGRGIRSLSPQGGAFSPTGAREQIREVNIEGLEIHARFGSRVPYLPLHEHGGTIPAMTIRPVKAKALHFFINGQEVFAKKVELPARSVQARPFLSPALKEAEPKIMGIIENRIIGLWANV